MPTLSELRTELFSELAKRPAIDGFFQSMLRKRVNRAGWLDNTLVQLVLRHDKLEALEKLIEGTRQIGTSLLEEIAGGLKGSESHFDTQLVDVLAELNAALWLNREGYSGITKLKRSHGKTPDFRAVKEEKEQLFEVKNLRAPHDVLDILFTRLTRQSLLNPTYYNKIFTVSYTQNQQLIETVDDTDYLHVMKFGELLDDYLRSDNSRVKYSYSKRDGGRGVDSRIECSWRDSHRFDLHWTSSGYAYDPGESRSTQMLMPLIRKTWNHVCRAVEQLTEYDKGGTRDVWVLLNWQRPDGFVLDDTIISQYRESVEGMDKILATVNPKLHLRILD